MIEELKPCPFCGGEAHISLPDDDWDGYCVGCDDCNVYMGLGFGCGLFPTLEEATTAWNRRVNDED